VVGLGYNPDMRKGKNGCTRRERAISCRLWTVVVGTAIVAIGGFATAAEYLGPSAVVASGDGKTLYVANIDARCVAVVNLDTGKVTGSIAMPAPPTGLALSPCGEHLYVTCAGPKSTVVIVGTGSRKSVAKIAAGHTATGPAVSPDGRRLYVCNRFDNDVSVIDLATRKELARVPVTREPVAAAVTPDGRSVVVANHLPGGPGNRFFMTCNVTIIDARSLKTTAIALPNGATGLRGVCILPGGKYALVTHVLGNFELVPSQVEQGWTNTNAVSVIDPVEKKLYGSFLLDDNYLGAANPWGIACTADGRTLCVAQSGTHELSIIDVPSLFEALRKAAKTRGPMDGPSILTDFRQRVELPGKGPRSVAIAGSVAYVAEYFSDTVDAVDLSHTPDELKTIALGPKPKLTPKRRGEMLFHDATICYQHWQSCASCHPDARSDGLNWDLLNDGVGNPKNAKSMMLAHRTPPAMALGVRATGEDAVRAGIEHILFSVQPESDAAAIDAWLKSLRPVPSPRLVDGRLSPAARRGEELFESKEVGCSRCHPKPLLTDLRMHDVATGGGYDGKKRFDTPTLIEVWRTAPYLHDGRYATIKELITKGKHGLSSNTLDQLTKQQINDLVEYVLSL